MEKKAEVEREVALEKVRLDAENTAKNIAALKALAADVSSVEDLLNSQINDRIVEDSASQNENEGSPEKGGKECDTLAPSEVSRIFRSGASALMFDHVRSSKPTRDDSKWNASIGSENCLVNEEDSAKKLRLDTS